MGTDRLFLLDAYALIFRAYYALINMPRITSSGFNTSAVFGFVNTLEELLRKERPTHMAVCFDPPGPTFRHEAYEAYKGEREATPEDIKLSVPVIKEIIEAYRIPIVEVPGFEADDVIGTLAVKAEKEGFTTFMMTPDKDFGQLVTDRIFQLKPAHKGSDIEVRGPEQVCAKYGLQTPHQVIDLLALMGDKADNIPGCPGVGEKTAVKLIGEFGDVETMLSRSAELKGALRKKVEDNSEQILFSKFLATIRTDVPTDATPENLAIGQPDMDKLSEIFRRLEFRQLAERVKRRVGGEQQTVQPRQASVQPSLFDMSEPVQEPSASKPLDQKEVKIVSTEDEVATLADAARHAGECGLFVVADGQADMTARWLGAAVSLPDGTDSYIPLSASGAKAMLLNLMADPAVTKVTPAAKRDFIIAAREREPETPLAAYYDTAVAHYLIQPEMRHSTDILAQTLLGLTITTYADIAGPAGARQPSPSQLPQSDVARWAASVARASLMLRPELDRLIAEADMQKLLTEVELPLVAVLARMEMAGVRIDTDALAKASAELEAELQKLEAEIYALAGEEFNIGSPSKVGEILFVKLALDPKAKKTKSGQYSTNEEILEKLAVQHPIAGLIIRHRQMRKLISTYLNALPGYINPQTGKIHTTYNQTVTATGRLSSSDPNLQNIPVRDEMGRDIRRAFIPDPGHLFLSADYSQIELRLVADIAKDEVMTDAFNHGRDIHAITAARIYHTDPEHVTPEWRRNAKTANFGILYGISAFGLAQRLGIPRQEAKQLIDGYFATFPSIRKYMDSAIDQARADGYVTTLHGRRRMLPDINSRNPVVRGYAERNAINAPIQGTAADIIKIAMVRIAEAFHEKGLKSQMIMQVHDELNFDVLPEELDTVRELVTTLMAGAYSGGVTLEAQCGVGANWLEAH